MIFSFDTEKWSENNELNIWSLRCECCNSQNKFGDGLAPTMNSLVIDDVLKSRDDNGADVLELRYFVQSVGEPVLTVLQLGGKL